MQVDVGIAVGVIGCIMGVLGWLRNRDSDKGASIKVVTELKIMLQNALDGIKDINETIKTMTTDVRDLDRRVTKIEVRMNISEESKGEKND